MVSRKKGLQDILWYIITQNYLRDTVDLFIKAYLLNICFVWKLGHAKNKTDMTSHSFGASDRKESGIHSMLQVRQSALEARASARCPQEGCPSAKSRSLFKSEWQGCLGWICCLVLHYECLSKQPSERWATRRANAVDGHWEVLGFKSLASSQGWFTKWSWSPPLGSWEGFHWQQFFSPLQALTFNCTC